MSLESLIGNDTVSFAHPVTTKDASGGMVITFPTEYASNEPGRMEDLSADAIENYKASNLVVTHRIFGQTEGVEHGDRAESDGRYLIVRKVQKRRAIGNMPTFYVYVGEEWRPGS